MTFLAKLWPFLSIERSPCAQLMDPLLNHNLRRGHGLAAAAAQIQIPTQDFLITLNLTPSRGV
jgi:hypothetical protein